jgi:hypothetical protein
VGGLFIKNNVLNMVEHIHMEKILHIYGIWYWPLWFYTEKYIDNWYNELNFIILIDRFSHNWWVKFCMRKSSTYFRFYWYKNTNRIYNNMNTSPPQIIAAFQQIKHHLLILQIQHTVSTATIMYHLYHRNLARRTSRLPPYMTRAMHLCRNAKICAPVPPLPPPCAIRAAICCLHNAYVASPPYVASASC